jgi:hypothetical protein
MIAGALRAGTGVSGGEAAAIVLAGDQASFLSIALITPLRFRLRFS